MDELKHLLRKVPSLSPASFRQPLNEGNGNMAQDQARESVHKPIVVAGVAAAKDAENEHV